MKPFRSRFITFGLTVGLFIQFGLPVLPQKDSSNASTPVTERSQAGVTPRRESETVALKELIEEALDRNPEIRSMQRSFDMMRARVPQAKALPDPMLEFGYMGNVTPVPPFDLQKGDPSSARMVSFSQEIPFPGKLSLKGRMAEAEAQSEWWAYEQLLLNVRPRSRTITTSCISSTRRSRLSFFRVISRRERSLKARATTDSGEVDWEALCEPRL